MRSTKIRAWDEDSSVMVYEVGITPEGIPYTIPDDAEHSDQFDYYPSAYVMHTTGIKDGHGTEIYDGDIIHIDKRFNGVDIYGKVYWKGAGYAMLTRRGSDTSTGYLEMVIPFGVAVGNIYENPELLGD